MAIASFLAFIFLSRLLLMHSTEDDKKDLPICPESFQCGNHSPISFPFTNTTYPDCGLVVDCHDTMHIFEGRCDDPPFISFEILNNLTFFKCNDDDEPTPETQHYFRTFNKKDCPGYSLHYKYPDEDEPTSATHPHECSAIQLPAIWRPHSHPFRLLNATSLLQFHISHNCWKCQDRGGQCPNINQEFLCHDVNGKKKKYGFILGAGILPGVVLLVAVILLCCFGRRWSLVISRIFSKKEREKYQQIELFLKNYGSLASKRYSYSDVKKMTNSFAYKLGQGGYGGVYKGKLQNGHLVAVKVLTDSKGNGEEFTNEVASISKTSHVNVVTLLGFCFEGTKRALIYEFMPNGSLEKFIYDESSSLKRQLGWETLYQIAAGIARGLEYLHRGCNTRILHFDIKPHNILLDEDFCPKISDFGLSKLCSKKDSIISMLGARGTAGYIAPEVFSRSFGGVSHKSDVYSYGMMVLEMVGGRKNIDVGVDHTSEIYFPHWIYKRVELDEDLGLYGIMNEEQNERVRKMIIVGLWCIQIDPSNRPSISKVMEMLEGSLEFLQIPPKPILSSPPRPPADSSNTQIL